MLNHSEKAVAELATEWKFEDGQHPLTRQQEAQLREDLSAVEELLQAIGILMRACHGEDSQVAIRAAYRSEERTSAI